MSLAVTSGQQAAHTHTHTHILLAVRHVPLAFFKGVVLLRGKPGNGCETGGKLFIIDLSVDSALCAVKT